MRTITIALTLVTTSAFDPSALVGNSEEAAKARAEAPTPGQLEEETDRQIQDATSRAARFTAACAKAGFDVKSAVVTVPARPGVHEPGKSVDLLAPEPAPEPLKVVEPTAPASPAPGHHGALKEEKPAEATS
jgi:hypothetical protein